MIDDLINSVCVICKDGLNYRFTHRSFQEYFTAVFLKELSDESLKKMGLELIKKDPYRATDDSVFSMLYDMSEERTEQNIILPLLELIEKDCQTDKYDFYFTKIEPIFEFDFFEPDSNVQLGIKSKTGDEYVQFIRKYVLKYRRTNNHDTDIYENKLLKYLEVNMDYKISDELNGIEILDDKELYELFKRTWVGDLINTVANLRDTLIREKKKYELNLNDLILY